MNEILIFKDTNVFYKCKLLYKKIFNGLITRIYVYRIFFSVT